MASLFDLIKYAPESTTPGIAANPYDWSSLQYLGAMPNLGMPGGFDSGSGFDPQAPTYANVSLPGFSANLFTPDYSFQSTFGSHSGVTQNPDGTFTAQRRVQNNPDSTAYETTQYKLSDDGKNLVPVNNQWSPITIKDTGFFESIGDAAGDFAGVLGEALPTLAVPIAASLLYPALSGAASGAAGAAEAGIGTLSEDALLPFSATAGSTAPLELTGTLPTYTPALTASTLPLMATGTLPTYTPSVTSATLPAIGSLPTSSSGSGLLGTAASGAMDFITKNPSLFGTLLGGALGGGLSGGQSYDVGNRTPLKPLERPTFTPRKEDYGTWLPSGLGNQSAGLFAEYMRRMGG